MTSRTQAQTTQTSALVIPHIPIDFIQRLFIILSNQFAENAYLLHLPKLLEGTVR
jgi:hypothetical protein